MNKKKVCVVGIGIMGSGIVQTCAQAGYDVSVVYKTEDSFEEGFGTIKKDLSRLVKKERIEQAKVDRLLDAIRANATMDLKEGAKDADVVIEAVSEDLELKKELFRIFGLVCPEHAILGSNTSTFPITALAAATKRPDRVIGIHFMNPVPQMRGVEIIKSLRTSEDTLNSTLEFVHSLGKETVVVNDSPGFVTSRMMCLILNEAVKMRESGLASVEDIDKIQKLSFNWPLGPFQLLDLIGIDIVVAVLNTIYDETGFERFKPAVLMVQMVRAGWTGQKAGKGFYDYK